jgi:hypothetical protein
MSAQAIAGLSVIVVVLALINILMFWCWRSIGHISRMQNKHLRQILKERRVGR